MRPTTRDLVGRDLATASVLGLSVLTNGQPDFGSEFSEFGVEGDYSLANLSNRLGARDVGHGLFGNATQLDQDASRLRGASHEDQYLRHIAHQAEMRAQRTQERLELLDPNRDSSEKIGRFSFSLNQTLVLGAVDAIAMTNNPLTDIRPDRIIFNAPCYGFAMINVIQAGNLSILVGGSEDAANYTQVSVNVHVSMPLITTSNRAQVAGSYSGLSPAPYTSGAEFPFVCTFQGAARMTI